MEAVDMATEQQETGTQEDDDMRDFGFFLGLRLAALFSLVIWSLGGWLSYVTWQGWAQ